MAQLRLTGNDVGLIPDGMTLDEWESEDRSSHPVEMLSPKGILATPMVAGMLFGQLCDGLATMVGIDWFGYSESIHFQMLLFNSEMVLIFLAKALGYSSWLRRH